LSDSLLRQLTTLNQNHRLLKDTQGGYAVILERGSRLTHLVPANSTESAVWTNISLIANPFLMIDSDEHRELAQIPYIGYQCDTRIQLLSETEHVPDAPLPEFNLWSILQVPPGGTVLVPVLGDSEPLVMYREQEEIHMNRQPHYASFPFEGGSSFKLSYNTLQSTGRLGYYRRLSKETSSLIVRQLQVNPSASYPDYPENQPDYTGSCMQFFYDGEKMGGFG
jgi:hypothetical protein